MIRGSTGGVRPLLLVLAATALAVAAVPGAGALTSGNTDHIEVTEELVQVGDEVECGGRGSMQWTRKMHPGYFEIVVTTPVPL